MVDVLTPWCSAIDLYQNTVRAWARRAGEKVREARKGDVEIDDVVVIWGRRS
jgi:hypothetical protein